LSSLRIVFWGSAVLISLVLATTTLPSSPPGLSPSASLTTALTVEGLLFAAFSVSYQLAKPKQGGRNRFFTGAWFGWLIVAALTCVAVSAAASWWATFQPDWPDTTNEMLRAGGLAVGIVAQPIFAAIINWQARGE